MNPIIRRLFSVVAVLFVLVASFVGWFFIEVAFDGCCAAPSNFSNDTAQGLTHLGAYLAALGLIWLALWWGWRKPKP